MFEGDHRAVVKSMWKMKSWKIKVMESNLGRYTYYDAMRIKVCH